MIALLLGVTWPEVTLALINGVQIVALAYIAAVVRKNGRDD